jgi:hypothetical protein
VSEPIKAGDLVVATRACCNDQAARCIGIPWTVSRIGAPRSILCPNCGARWTDVKAYPTQPYGPEKALSAPIGWLKRIPPFPELADEKHEEDLREPA